MGVWRSFLENVNGRFVETISIRAREGPWGLARSYQGRLGKTECVTEYTNLTPSRVCVIRYNKTCLLHATEDTARNSNG